MCLIYHINTQLPEMRVSDKAAGRVHIDQGAVVLKCVQALTANIKQSKVSSQNCTRNLLERSSHIKFIRIRHRNAEYIVGNHIYGGDDEYSVITVYGKITPYSIWQNIWPKNTALYMVEMVYVGTLRYSVLTS